MIVQLSLAGGIGCHLILALAVIVLTATILVEALAIIALAAVIVLAATILAEPLTSLITFAAQLDPDVAKTVAEQGDVRPLDAEMVADAATEADASKIEPSSPKLNLP